MDRRKFIRAAGVGGAVVASGAAAFPAPAISQGRMEWRMVTSWPKNLPGVGTGAERLAQRITEMSDGRLTVKVFAAGELVPALRCMDAVMDGTAEMGHDASFYHMGKHRALPVFFAVPFGMTSNEMIGWLNHGGGQQLWDEVNAPFNIVSFAAASTSAQSMGWFRKEINSLEDFKGLKMRIPGLGGELIKKLGGSAILLPAGEIFAALQSGAVDAAEFIGPLNDMALGFHQVSKICYGPGVQEATGVVQLMVDKRKYDALPKDLQQIVRYAANATHEDVKTEYDLRSGQVMEQLRTQHGVRFLRLNNDVLAGMGKAAGELVQEEIDKGDALTKKVYASYLKARQDNMRFWRFNEQAFLNARTLQFQFPTGA